MRSNAVVKTKNGQPQNKAALPSLPTCINAVKMLSSAKNNIKGRDQAELYVSSLAFLCHLKADQETLFEAERKQNIGDDGTITKCPTPDATPAITSVIADSELFQSLMTMLSTDSFIPTAPGKMQNNTSISLQQQQQQSQHQHQSQGRKRGGSCIESDFPHKAAKHHNSNTGNVTDRGKNHTSANAGALVSSAAVLSDKHKLSPPGFNRHTFAATVIFAAIRHLDHWPSPLMKAYAEDCFGARVWVDDENNSLLTKNLSLALVQNYEEKLDPETFSNAEKMANHYSQFLSNNVPTDKSAALGTQLKKTPHVISNITSLSNRTSFDESNKGNSSLSGSDSGEECVLEQMSVGSTSVHSIKSMKSVANRSFNKILPKKRKMAKNGKKLKVVDDSSSSGEDEGEEEVVVEVGFGSSSSKNPSATNSKSALQGKKQQAPISKQSNPPQQIILNLTQVRPRFVGRNRLQAEAFIIDALTERFKSKSKQNSRLIAALPDFVSVPKVRSVAASYLERWLQSPALSGLARSLFSAIVSNMRHIDPPLKDDISAIDSILSMKLKANQFSAHIDNITSIAQTIPTASVSRHLFLHLLREEFNAIQTQKMSTSHSKNYDSDCLRMFIAVHSAISTQLTADALSSAILHLMLNMEDSSHVASVQRIRRMKTISSLLQRVADALGSSYDGLELVKSLIERHSEIKKDPSIDEYDDIARLIFECMILIAPVPSKLVPSGLTQRMHTKGQLRKILAQNTDQGNASSTNLPPEKHACLVNTRKVVLKWCVSIYASAFSEEIRKENNESKQQQSSDKNDEYMGKKRVKLHKKGKDPPNISIVGAGQPVYSSVLDGQTAPSDLLFGSSASKHLSRTISCLLFLVNPNSKEMASFLSLGDSCSSIENEQLLRINMCNSYVTDLDDDILKIILEATALPKGGIDPHLALSLIESLFLKCRAGSSSSIKLQDYNIVWEMYNKLTEYEPISLKNHEKEAKDNDDSKNDEGSNNMDANPKKLVCSTTFSPSLARVAYPGRWWRVTAVILVMCGASPQSIGGRMWEMHPTVKALIKMTISGRYRFPTADCDEDEKEAMKADESKLREEESKIAETLFLPKSSDPNKKQKKCSPTNFGSANSGSRVSARQRQKQTRLLSRQRDEEAAIAQVEAQQLKKVLRAAQKSIMLFDPQSAARKPPKESVQLILSVDELFELSKSLRQCADPDFLMMTIGGSSRGSIERSHEWLIPIISSHPSIINRLPPNTSCFLLLRAYGSDEENRHDDQLLELAAPLLRHVSDCLKGKNDDVDAALAADILLTDIADSSPDRRRCARRVLQEAIGNSDSIDGASDVAKPHIIEGSVVTYQANFSWLFNLIHVKHFPVLVPDVIRCISRALSYERGRVLCSYVSALNLYIKFANENKIEGSYDFAITVCNLLSTRPQVCSAAFDRFEDFRDLVLTVVHKQWDKILKDEINEVLEDEGNDNDNDKDKDKDKEIKIRICYQPNATSAVTSIEKGRDVLVPLPLLRAAIVLVSNWEEDEVTDEEVLENSTNDSQIADVGEPKNNAVRNLVYYLIVTPSGEDQNDEKDTLAPGASGAIFFKSGKRAVSVEQWVLLAKSRCAFIAKHAALSAPVTFLPRLLLCCGLPRLSFVTMLQRLGTLGSASADSDRTFKNLLSPSATAEWGLGHLGNRRAIARKLIGRVSAYLRIYKGKDEEDDNEITSTALSSSFLVWLSEESTSAAAAAAGGGGGGGDRSKRHRAKKGAQSGFKANSSTPDYFKSLDAVKSLVHGLAHPESSGGKETQKPLFSDDDSSDESILFTASKRRNHSSPCKDEYEHISRKYIEECCMNLDGIANLEKRIEQAILTRDYHVVRDTQNTQDHNHKANRKRPRPRQNLCDIAIGIMKICMGSKQYSPALIQLTLKWVPLLTVENGNDTFWEHILALQSTQHTNIFDDNTADLLISRCIEVWSLEHIRSLQGWILSQIQNDDDTADSLKPSYHRCLRFLVITSEQQSVHKDAFGNSMPTSQFICVQSEQNANAAVSLALKCASEDFDGIDLDDGDQTENSTKAQLRQSDILKRCTGRNDLPDWVALILLVAKCGKNCCHLVTKRVLSHKQEKGFISSTVLRLYTYFPKMMGLGDAKLRKILLDAASTYASSWLDWRCPLDDQVHEIIISLSKNPQQRLVQALSDLSKQHPILVARKFQLMVECLEHDASTISPSNQLEKRGRIRGCYKSVAIAKTEHMTVKIRPKHWGCSFTEPLWLSILEVLISLPSEVIYSCGLKLGVLELFGVYFRLFVVQKHLECENNTSRISAKITQLFESFRISNRTEWERWCDGKIQGIESWGNVRQVAAKCNVTVGVLNEGIQGSNMDVK